MHGLHPAPGPSSRGRSGVAKTIIFDTTRLRSLQGTVHVIEEGDGYVGRVLVAQHRPDDLGPAFAGAEHDQARGLSPRWPAMTLGVMGSHIGFSLQYPGGEMARRQFDDGLRRIEADGTLAKIARRWRTP